MKKILLFALANLIFPQFIFSQFGTKGLIQTESGINIKPKRIESKLYDLVGRDSIITNSRNLLERQTYVFDSNSRQIKSCSYQNQDKEYKITEQEYDKFGNTLNRLEKSHNRPDRFYSYNYEYDSLGNWVTKSIYTLRDTLKFKECYTREIHYSIKEINSKIDIPKIIFSKRYFGSISKVRTRRSGIREHCGTIDIKGDFTEVIIEKNSSLMSEKLFLKGEIATHKTISDKNGRREFNDLIRNEEMIYLTDTVFTSEGFEIKRRKLKDGKEKSERISKYNLNGDLISVQTLSDDPRSHYVFDKEYQYLEYNEFGEWTRRLYFSEGELYFLTERKIEYQIVE